MRNIFLSFLLSLFLVSCSSSGKSETKLPFFTDLKSSEGWSLDVGAKFDPNVSVDASSGSIKLENAGKTWVMSDRIISNFKLPVKAGKTYTLSFKSKTDTFPPPSLEVYGALLGESGMIENSNGTMCSNSKKGEWEENFVVIDIPKNEMIKYLKIKILMLAKYGKSAPIWIDDIKFEEGLKLPKTGHKKSFEGAVTKVDKEGNIEIKKDGKFVPFFPIGIYVDENRNDWSVYKKMGFNLNMWVSGIPTIKKSKDAGLYSMMQIVQYIVPVDEEWIPQDPKKKIDHLNKTLHDIKSKGYFKDLLFYYVDNEFYHLKPNFTNIINIVRDKDGGAHPIYMLSGAYGMARKYNDYIDLTGTYVADDGYETPIIDTFEVLRKTPNQTQPVVFAQINRGVGKNFRPILYGAIAKGAKGVGFWRDGGSAGKIEKRAIYQQLPTIAKEIKKLMPVIRSDLKSGFDLKCDKDDLIFGTRSIGDEGYLIVANPTRGEITARFEIKDSSFKPNNLKDYFTDNTLGKVENNIFSLSIKPQDAKVVKLLK